MTAALRRRLGLTVTEPPAQPEPTAEEAARAERFHTYGITR